MSSTSYFDGDKIDADYFKDEIIPSLKANGRLKIYQHVEMNYVRDKGKPR